MTLALLHYGECRVTSHLLSYCGSPDHGVTLALIDYGGCRATGADIIGKV